MMKFFSLVLALLMMVFGMFAFDSCEEKPSDDKNVEDNKEDNKQEKKDDAELILGTWEAEIDYTEVMNSDFGLDEEMADYIKVEDFKFTVRATMNEDGTYKFVVTEESSKKALDKFKKAMVWTVFGNIGSMVISLRTFIKFLSVQPFIERAAVIKHSV